MLWLGAHDAPGEFRWRPDVKALLLTIEARARPLFGEVAQSRLKALGQAMGAEAKVAFAG
jgi:exopolyphosphatase/guanosine-5'-triphosphate,3'-diphosphate pyrophosphatase